MLRPYLYVVLNSQQFGRTSFRQRLELVARPEGRPTRNLAHEPVADPGLAREALNVRLGGKEAVRAALHDEAARSLGDGDAAGPPFRFAHDAPGTRARERPRRGQAREPRPHHRDRYSHPRPAAVLCASSATAPTSNGSSFSEGGRPGRAPELDAQPLRKLPVHHVHVVQHLDMVAYESDGNDEKRAMAFAREVRHD